MNTAPAFMEETGRSSGAAVCRQPVVVVLGMHRSGTSLLANLLTVLGVDLGDRLLAGDANNEAGYWEQEEIYRIQDDVLQQLGRRWIGPAGTVPFAADWWRRPEFQPFKERLTAIVRAEVSRAQGIWGFKDPRTSRLLPLWTEIFTALDLEPFYLLSIRDPATVVESVVKRDEIPAPRAELLWLLHNLDAIRDAGEQLRLVVDYDRWFTHPEQQARAVLHALDLEPPGAEAQWLEGICERIRPDLRHCRSPRQFSLPLVAETYAALQEAAATGRLPDKICRIDAEVRRSLALCEPWAAVVEELTRPPTGTRYSFVDHFAEGRLEPLGRSAKAEIWDALIDGPMRRAVFLHPPARLCFTVPDGRRARLTFAVNIHPLAWKKPKAGGCEFFVTVNGATQCSVRLDPVNVPSDRQWHECTLDIPESPIGAHEVVFETRAIGGSLDFRWAVWREPQLTWDTPAPPAATNGSSGSHPEPNPASTMNPFTDTPPPHAVPQPFARPDPETAVALTGDGAELKRMARDCLAANRHEAARALCRHWLLDNPRDREALDLLGQCRFDLKSLDGQDAEEVNPAFLLATRRSLFSNENPPPAVPVPLPAGQPLAPVVPPSPAASTDPQVRRLARAVGDDWKQQPYYGEAEQYIEKQWRELIWPYMGEADFSCVLDLAAGHGRNSEKLKQHARKIYIVDINQENIDFCRQRFAGDPRFEFFRNDGCSLDFIPTGSLSLVYCFDAMVHFDSDVVRAYLREFQRVLRSGGLGFCHHSNYTKNPGGDVHQNPGWRNFMSQALFAHYCAREGLTVLKSRVLDWCGPESDCVTLFKKP